MLVGQASATGQALDIPIIIRSLADSLTLPFTATLPLQFHESFLAILDAGVPFNSPCVVVPRHYMEWWNEEFQPHHTMRLMRDNLYETVTFFEEQLPEPNIPRAVAITQAAHHIVAHESGAEAAAAGPPSGISPLQKRNLPKADPKVRKGLHVVNLPPNTPATPTNNLPDCAKCQEYRTLSSELVTELHSISQYAQAAEKFRFNQVDLDMRRAAGFYTLHETVLQKELQADADSTRKGKKKATVPAPAPATRSRKVAATAAAELKRYKSLPAGSHKWTWGPTLSAEEVLDLVKNPKSRKLPHSGYDASLPSGPPDSGIWTLQRPRDIVSDQTNVFSKLASDGEDIVVVAEDALAVAMAAMEAADKRESEAGAGASAATQAQQPRLIAGDEAEGLWPDSPEPVTANAAAALWPDSDGGDDAISNIQLVAGDEVERIAAMWPESDGDDADQDIRLVTGDEAERIAAMWSDSRIRDDQDEDIRLVTGDEAAKLAEMWSDGESDDDAAGAEAVPSTSLPPTASLISGDQAEQFWGDLNTSDEDLSDATHCNTEGPIGIDTTTASQITLPQWNAADFTFLDQLEPMLSSPVENVDYDTDSDE